MTSIFRSYLRRVLFLVFALCGAGGAHAQVPGNEDPAWTVNAYGPLGYRTANDLAIDSSGRLLVVGHEFTSSSSEAPSYLVVRRYAANGSLDASFADGGIAYVVLHGRGDQIAVDALGRIYVAGWVVAKHMVGTRSLNERSLLVTRLHADGTVDADFGNGGFVRIPWEASYNDGGPESDETWLEQQYNSVTPFAALEIQPDGRILLGTIVREGASPELSSFVVARLLTNGQLDGSFGTNGLFKTPFGGTALQPLADGSLLLLSAAATGASTSTADILKLNAQGAPDASFGTNGRAGFANAYPNDLALQSDGQVIVSGYSGNAGTVLRLNTDGTLDTGFGDAGFTALDGSGLGLSVQPDDRILVQSGVDQQLYLTQLGANGEVDSNFARAQAPDMYFTGSLAVSPQGAFSLTAEYDDGLGGTYTSVRKFLIDPWPRSGSLSTGQDPSVSGFQVDTRNNSGTLVDSASLSQAVGIAGYIFPQSADANASADLFVVVATSRGLYMRNAGGGFVPWDRNFSSLVPAYEDVTLTSTVQVPVYGGPLPFAGPYYVYLGYQREGGPVIYIDEPARLDITQ